jgi:hypothetical protein
MNRVVNVDEVYSFSQPELRKFLSDHLDKIAWACILITIAYVIVSRKSVSSFAVILFILFASIPFFYSWLKKKFAYKIVIDFKSSEIQLYMYRSKRIIKAGFNDLKSIRVNGYIIILLEEEKIFYNDLQNYELFECLNKIIKLHWGPLCPLWGPNKKVRNALDKDRVKHQL